MAEQVAENGEAKNRRRTSRPLAKAASIMDIVEAIEDVVVAEVDTEDEAATAETANQDEDVEDIAAEVIHRPLCSNRHWLRSGRQKGFLCAVSKPYLHDDFLFRLSDLQKSSYSSLERGFSLLAMHCEILETRLDVFKFLFSLRFLLLATLHNLYNQDHGLDRTTNKGITISEHAFARPASSFFSMVVSLIPDKNGVGWLVTSG